MTFALTPPNLRRQPDGIELRAELDPVSTLRPPQVAPRLGPRRRTSSIRVIDTREATPATVTVRPRANTTTTCPYCRDHFAEVMAPGQRITCGGCRAVYHHDCWSQLGGCGTFGCTGSKQKTGLVGAPALPETPSTSNGTSGWWGLWWIVWLIIQFILMSL